MRYDQKYILIITQSASYSCQILVTLNFLDIFPKNTLLSNFMYIRPVGAELFLADGQTNRQP
jgi:hypothetical protein